MLPMFQPNLYCQPSLSRVDFDSGDLSVEPVVVDVGDDDVLGLVVVFEGGDELIVAERDVLDDLDNGEVVVGGAAGAVVEDDLGVRSRLLDHGRAGLVVGARAALQ